MSQNLEDRLLKIIAEIAEAQHEMLNMIRMLHELITLQGQKIEYQLEKAKREPNNTL